MDIIDDALKISKQVVLTGAPGTGKTYSVREYVKKHTVSENQYRFVQFHPSYDYSDFVEGLRPVEIKGNPTFVRIDGAFKDFCRKIVEHNLICAYGAGLTDTQKEAKIDELFKYAKSSKDSEAADDTEDKNAIKENYSKFNNPLDEEGKEIHYYFIIDEINRADLSKVFGELMFGLEESYRGIGNRFATQYANLPLYGDDGTGKIDRLSFDCFKNGFFIPENLYIIGTMNDIDRSVEAFDFALRRRFKWIEVKANEVFKDGITGILKGTAITSAEIDDLTNKVIAMNNVISKDGNIFMLTEAYHIGHSYFKVYNGPASIKTIFDNNVTPILKEYTRGRRGKDVEDQLLQPCRDALGI